MKYKFESENIVISQIKELLKDFNLPMIPVYTDESVLLTDKVYIKGNEVVKWDGEKFVKIHDYYYNKKIINLTKNFIINSSNYDQYTHRYLGEYLRFLRDYKHIDLMSLYNCFDYAQPSRIVWRSTIKDQQYLNIDTTNDCYTYYVVPVKFNKTYTIAIDADIPYEMSCILFNNNFIDFTPITLRKKSYKRVNGSRYSSPYVYNTSFFDESTLTTLANENVNTSDYVRRCVEHEKDLYLLLKLPIQVNSTITILEGNFVTFANVVDRQLVTKQIASKDSSWSTKYFDKNGNEVVYPSKTKVVKTEVYDNTKVIPQNLLTKSSLLKVNNHISYPFADRLIEFLLGNTIDSLDKISDNVQRTQANLVWDELYDEKWSPVYRKYDGLWTDTLRQQIYDYMKENVKDIWSNRIIYSYFKDRNICEYRRRGIDLNSDLTGYVDKDTEQYLEVR